MHYLPLVVYPHTNQPQPTATDHQPATATPYTYNHLSYYLISLYHHYTRRQLLHTPHVRSYRPIYLYNIIYLSTILYPISYLTNYTRAIISKRQPTARPDTLYRYTYYISTHSMTSTRHQIRNGNSWR